MKPFKGTKTRPFKSAISATRTRGVGGMVGGVGGAMVGAELGGMVGGMDGWGGVMSGMVGTAADLGQKSY